MGSQLLFDEVWKKWKEQQLDRPVPILRRLLSLEINPDSIKALAARLVENRDIVLSLAPAAPELSVEKLWLPIVEAVRRLEKLKKHCTCDGDRGRQQIERLVQVLSQTAADELDRERAIFFDLHVDGNAGAQSNWFPASSCADQKSICAQLKTILEDARQRLGESLTAGVLAWLTDFLNEVEKEKRARGVLDFQDLLLKARDLVRDRADVRSYFQQRIRFLLVDEFQDTDPLQAELVFFLAEEGATARDWREVRLCADKLFLVGDPKQSIYRFRRADIQVYEKAKQILTRLNEPLVIQQNFRSSPFLLKVINDLFAPQMIAGDYQAAYVPLEPAPDRPNAGPGLALLFPPDTYVPDRMSAYFAAEADFIARYIKSVCHVDASPVKVWDKQTRQPRTPAFRDVAVLLPVTTSLACYEDAFRSCGVPFQVDAGRQFYARRETRDLISVLRAVDNPEDAIPVVAALRSPFFGLSDEDLLLYRHAGGSFQYLRKAVEGFPRMAQSFEQLRRWHRGRAAAPLSSVVDTVLDESCVLPFFLLLPDGEQAVANLLRIVELARQFEGHPGACLRSFVDWLEQREASELAERETPFGDEQDDVVHILTIHTAKGLEFPIVALASMGCNQRSTEDVLVDHARGEVALSLKCGEQRMKSANFDSLAAVEHDRARAEDLRLFYVAATRAKDCLVIPRVSPPNGRNPRFLDFFQSQLAVYGSKPRQTTCANGVLLVRAEDLPEPNAPATVLRRNVGAVTPADALVAPIVAERDRWQHSLKNAGLRTAETKQEAAVWQRDGGEKQWRAGATAKALGTAFHRIMHQVQLQGDPLIDAIVEAAAVDQEIPQQAATLKDWVTRALASPLLERARRARRLWREVPFCIDHAGAVTEGYIDLLFEEPDGLVLVDYKTEDVQPLFVSSTADSHRPQLEIYREAIRQFAGRNPKEVALYFVRPGMVQTVDFS
jgi:ATP-dependent helicase/nuclease subunit A